MLADGDEIQIGKYKLTFLVPGADRPWSDVTETAELLFDVGDEKLLTIGSVVERLRGEFPDISVSKLRYLEEQGLVTPRRTKSGYRLYSQDDFNRLVRVLAHAARRVPAAQGHPSRARAQPRRRRCPSARQGLRKTDLLARGRSASTRPRRSSS